MQADQGTQNEIHNLMKSIESSDMPMKKKEKLLEQFRNIHRMY